MQAMQLQMHVGMSKIEKIIINIQNTKVKCEPDRLISYFRKLEKIITIHAVDNILAFIQPSDSGR